jgi:hypothetical protein
MELKTQKYYQDLTQTTFLVRYNRIIYISEGTAKNN